MKQTLRTQRMRVLLVTASLLLGAGAMFAPPLFAQYTPGNLVVLRVGDGTTPLSSTATPINLVEYSPSGGAAINTLPMPTAASGANARLTMSGSAGSEGALNRSADGRYLVLVGYDAAVATAGVASATGINRVVGRVDAARNINTTTILPQSGAYNTNNIRSAVSNDGTQFWTAGTATTSTLGGVRYTTLGATDGGVQLSSAPTNTRIVGIYTNQLYVSSSTGSFTGVSSIGTGLPTTTGQTTTLQAGASNAYAFVFFDRDPAVAGVDLLYIADQTNGIFKYSYNGTIWTARGSLTGGVTGLTGAVNGDAVDLYTTLGTNAGNTIYKVTDVAVYNATITGATTAITAAGTLVATAPANTAFRGIAFAPVSPDITIGLSAPTSATLNQPINYSLVVSNQGNSSASGIAVQFALPTSASATYNSTGDAGGFTGSESGGIVTFSGGALAAGASTTLTVNVTPTVTGALMSGTALVDPSNTIAENNETNNSAAAVTTAIGSDNLPPIAPSIANQVATVGTAFSFTVPAFTDPESQTLSYAITGLSNGLSADNITRIISGTPTATGVQTVTIVATDPASNTISTTFSVSVNTPGTPGQIRITEYMYNPGAGGGEFIEITNVGNTPVDMTGWSFDDSHRTPGVLSLTPFGTLQPNESAIITEVSASAFRTLWGLPTTVKIIGNNIENLARADEINLYDGANAQVDRLTYNDQGTTPAGTIRTQAISGWTQRANLGTNTIAGWVLSTINDAQFSYAATNGDIGNPGGYFTPVPRTLVTFAGTSLTVAEGGAASTYTVALANAPTADVIVTPAPGSQLTVNPTSLTFTPANFGTAQTVTVTAVDDALVEGIQSMTITHRISSSDAGYNAAIVRSVPVTILDNDVAAGAAPTIQVASTNTAYLNLPTISGVINDPTDPASTIGVSFSVADADTPASNLTLIASSSNQAVAPNANLVFSGTDALRNLKITPAGVGYATVTVVVSDGTNTANYAINYAASAASTTPSSTRFHTGASDASTAIVVDANYMLVGDDESQVLRLYNRQNSGLPINGFDYSSSLALPDVSGGVPREVDIEASVISGNRIYWIGSQSNKEGGGARPNRDRVFATDVTLNGANTTLAYVSRYDYLREDIIAWDVNNVHGKGANYYGLQASADAAVDSKSTIGYNIEGAEFAPDGSTVYIGFRAPQVPLPARAMALVIPVTNLTSILAVNGGVQGSATFGAPIELDLGGRGIREIRKNAANQYLIIAGPAGSDTGTPPNNFRLYTWTGVPTDAPMLRHDNLSTLAVNGSFESIVEMPATLADNSQIQVLVDNGDAVYYNDGTIAKELSQNNVKKFRSDIATLGAPVKADLTPTLILPQANFADSGPDATRNFIINLNEVGGLPTPGGSIVITITAPVGYIVSYANSLTTIDVSGSVENPTAVDNTKWAVTDNLADRQLTLTINQGQTIAASGKTTLGFTITRTTASPGSVSSITINVKDDASQTYDGNSANNVYARIINGL